MQNQKGFTIIELIVVIAIIAVLATIVMVNVVQYIGKSKDAAIKGNMQTIASTAAGIFDTYKSYNNTATNSAVGNPTAANAINQINSLSSASANTTAHNNTSSWCVCAQLTANSANTYCVDGTGYKGESANLCSARCSATSQNCGG